MSNRKFFSGNSIRQAVVAAASHFEMPPEEVAYREVDKKHGFLKMRKKVIIEVNADDPRTAPKETPAPERKPDEPARVGQAAPRGASRSSSEAALSGEPGRRRDRRTPEEIAEEQREVAKRLKDLDEDEEDGGGQQQKQPQQKQQQQQQQKQQRQGRQQGRGQQQRGRGRQQRGRQDRGKQQDRGQQQQKQQRGGGKPQGRQERGGGQPSDERRGDERRSGGRREDKELVELREKPRAVAERFQEAEGEKADATRKALEYILDVGGLELEVQVFDGENQLEVELSGRDEVLLTAEGGELLRSVEHLLRRAARGVAGQAVRLRVNCGDFRELHEERLRSLAQREAAEVRKHGESRKLDPMNPADRRIVHLTLQDEPDVSSSSEGRGHFKQVVVKPE